MCRKPPQGSTYGQSGRPWGQAHVGAGQAERGNKMQKLEGQVLCSRHALERAAEFWESDGNGIEAVLRQKILGGQRLSRHKVMKRHILYLGRHAYVLTDDGLVVVLTRLPNGWLAKTVRE